MNWNKLYLKALEHKRKGEEYLDLAVQQLARDCGFSYEESLLFSADFASGTEAVVRYDGEGEMADLEIRYMYGMRKEDILKRLREYK